MTSERNRIDISDELKRKMLEVARDFRKNPTQSEALLWQELRGKKLNGIKFRRQQPIGPFVVDFYAPSIRLVVEIDGAVHQQQQEADQTRQMILESLDLKIIRFSASQVEDELDSVLAAICLKAEEILFAMGVSAPRSVDRRWVKGEEATPLSVHRRGVGGEGPQHE
jgi:very-short-patch-repair endonuclease